ncbi:PE-PGRS family protein [Delftia sp. Cs1-4]|uniref:hypothetical protein n=1 Tax=Delftia sp. (strain Cs1-4) TaxID=742013 RepID=UPI00020E89E0|nr:hypothetical protein [Delftia sp. Cs1-4]AEF91365.1 PE-PGRS family protein [Delftia sp. Cs1-4]
MTWKAPANGILEIRAMGAGGAGAARSGTTNTVTGGFAGSWGAKRLRVRAGDLVVVAVGAAGAVAVANQNGGAGGNTTITVAGVSYVAYGGPGGRYALASAGAIVLPAGPAPSANWDMGAASVRPGMLVGGATGGAGVDIMAKGGDATTSAAINGSGGGGTSGPGAGFGGGGVMPNNADATGALTINGGTFFDASDLEWGISFFGGGGGAQSGGQGYPGGNGGGGAGSSGNLAAGRGGNGGGGGASAGNGFGGSGGLGGGGGAGAGAGSGGDGYAFLKFFADKGV